MDLLAAVAPKAVRFLGKCGGFKKTRVGDFILPIAAIRGEGTSNDYPPPEIPALPSFRLQKAVSAMIVKQGFDYWTGTIHTTNQEEGIPAEAERHWRLAPEKSPNYCRP